MENNEEIDAPREIGEEEILSKQNQITNVESMHNIDPNWCEVLVRALEVVPAPETIKIVGYIKKQKVIVLINSRSTHNIIDKKISIAPQLFCISSDKFSSIGC